jgi:hypothetical protein
MKPGSWLQNYPHFLELSYQATHRLLKLVEPVISKLGFSRVDRWMRPLEDLSKGVIFDCRMCGQCILHSTGMTCPMTCPKNLRNGPCGGVRSNGHCEVIPEMECVWVSAFERSQRMPAYGSEMMILQPPVNRQIEGSSAWINMLSGIDHELPARWEETSRDPVIKIEDVEAWKPNLNQTVV